MGCRASNLPSCRLLLKFAKFTLLVLSCFVLLWNACVRVWRSEARSLEHRRVATLIRGIISLRKQGPSLVAFRTGSGSIVGFGVLSLSIQHSAGSIWWLVLDS